MTSEEFSQFLNELSIDSFPLIHSSISKSDYVSLDLSKDNIELKNIDVSSSDRLEVFITNYIQTNNAKVAFGGYLETREIYSRSSYFNSSNSETERNIHLGLDLWIEAETPIFTPIDATVHSFKVNKNFGDYGPTIILKHNINEVEFYTLYGHLSLSSIENLKVGEGFQKGKQLGFIGDSSINGDYPPHLHFQVIKDIQDYIGDYPGVCSIRDLEYYKENCPDPCLLMNF